MTEVSPSSKVLVQESATISEANANSLTPLRCWIGAAIASVLSYGMYSMTHAIALSFAAHKIQSSSFVVLRLSAAVRTLVVGMVTLGTFVFGFAALGLAALGIQLLLQRFKKHADPPSKS